MLKFDPNERYSAQDCLNHKFFKGIKFDKKVLDIPLPNFDITLKPMMNSKLRNLVFVNLESIYDSSEKYNWYSTRILFHAQRLIEQSYSFLDSLDTDIQLKNKLKERLDRIFAGFSEMEKFYIIFYTCIYFAIKLFSSLGVAFKYANVTVNPYNTPKFMLASQKFEFFLIRKILKYKLYYNTVIDLIDLDQDIEIDIKTLFDIIKEQESEYTAQDIYDAYFRLPAD
jgi:hypothetical protein